VDFVPVGNSPVAVAFSSWVYVTNNLSDNVSVIAAFLSPLRVVATIPVGVAPLGVALGFRQ
jgi:YVTN family beta-propeller protein